MKKKGKKTVRAVFYRDIWPQLSIKIWTNHHLRHRHKVFLWFLYGCMCWALTHHNHYHHRNFVFSKDSETVKCTYNMLTSSSNGDIIIYWFASMDSQCTFAAFFHFHVFFCVYKLSVCYFAADYDDDDTTLYFNLFGMSFVNVFFAVFSYFGSNVRLFPVLCVCFFVILCNFFHCFSFGREMNTTASITKESNFPSLAFIVYGFALKTTTTMLPPPPPMIGSTFRILECMYKSDMLSIIRIACLHLHTSYEVNGAQ